MVKRCADSGFDLAAGKVEVVPTAHYSWAARLWMWIQKRNAGHVAGEDAGGGMALTGWR